MAKTRRKFGFLFLPLVAVTLAGAQPAAAHYVYEKHTTYASDQACVGGRGEISHGGGGGYAKADTYSWWSLWTPYGDIHCGNDWSRPPGYINTAYHLYKWDGYNSRWGYCTGTNWIPNNVATHQWYIWTNFGSWTPCGDGYYATQAHGIVWNGQWNGQNSPVWSGYHWLRA